MCRVFVTLNNHKRITYQLQNLADQESRQPQGYKYVHPEACKILSLD